MSDVAIRVENLGKLYRIGQRERYKALRDVLTDAMYAPIRRIRSTFRCSNVKRGDNNYIWALKDVSFEVKRSEVVGVIGRNGAGKTTLLKILSRITEPTEGYAEIHGRVGSLLEVGTGFHPELTGRENIYLNGAILGMKKAEIERKFDEIVAFAEIEKFMDTPVKRYSSGMYVRLAFAVAAHLEPEILLVDEVLAVGDVAFQKKCLGKMRDVAGQGRTVFFVSHNMAAVEALCSCAMILKEGENSAIGSPQQIISEYLQTVRNEVNLSLKDRRDRIGRGNIRFIEIAFDGTNGSNRYTIGDDILVRARVLSCYSTDVKVRVALSIRTTSEIGIISCDSQLTSEVYTVHGSRESTLVCRIYSPPLNQGEYYINIAIFHGNEPEDWVTSAARFWIEPGSFDNRINTNDFPVLSRFEWKIET